MGGGYGGPVAPFGSPYGPGMGMYGQPRRTNPVAPIILAVVMLSTFGMGAAVFFMMRSSPSHSHYDEPPTVATPAVPMEPSPVPTVAAPNEGANSALAMFEPKCSQGDANACIVCGTLYDKGNNGVPVDKVKARTYYERACSLGNKSGCIMRDQLKRKGG